MLRRSFLVTGAALAALPACANAPERSMRVAPRPNDILARSAPEAVALVAEAGLVGKVGFAVADANTGEVLEVLNPIRPQPPASVAKAVTALYALETLGAGHRFETRLVATGPIRGGRLNGDLVLVGGGDPALDTDGLNALAAGARAAGLTEVGGRLLVADGALPSFARIDRTQPDHVSYNPAVGAVNVNFNRVHFGWKRNGSGYATSLDARTNRFRPDVSSSRIRVADRSLPVYTYAREGAVDSWTVARGQLGSNGSRWLPVRNPAVYAGDVLRSMLRANGISAPAAGRVATAPAGTVLAREQGAELTRVARSMLRYSNNLTAEVLGLTATVDRGIRPPTLDASADVMSAWLAERARTRRADFDDHSGLNATTRISAADMVTMLTARGAMARLRPILKEMVIEGDARIPVQAKTGTLNFVSGLGGYFNARSGRPLAFATFCADLDRRNGLSLAERERPPGGRDWARRARSLQFDLIERWERVHA
ncbi:D-alanyl-D-alanine carboxypeptidase/D-alanyl-D-alanine endopeptidase [Jannaschia seohaensis]|uniref:D-alanyl-D-alanine carboxypeptidase / D-alanyl-D-alanine-endopeptidase (Penicillin-binding protein 4) n=1 Tax=Jannaschia seohaensis TaxID=475081 RepID=A0A2Y9C178_9RHOB|nr:D-alanyl-D-alanine carboxypeptidase/D-alanyl-D-alanine-endopeptidase [Jannaschia seohaensis]PWJ17399.1 D-alanyl-D-alanine carboxypeptidase/D-alanyl-D-alanine-endopeptidase (penicillin-binding protein 4) [Jannaschia seohaensis]SSA47462.1 D-alanyl-D-alanine carboxypeptidase / D-alanyl-D-alanine-endopeptidase (penicillin-binding protein 4) [Jannaschia seohaensis]